MENQQKVRRWFHRPWIVAALAVLFVLIIISLVPFGGEDGSALSINAGSIKSSNSMTTSSSTSGNDNAFYSAQRILVLNRSDHRVMHALAGKLTEQLEALDFVERVDCSLSGEVPADGSPLYDFYVVLEMPSFISRGLLATGRTVEATVRVRCGGDLFDSHHGYTDNFSPPFARVQMACTLEHESVSRGYESAGARYAQVIDDMAKQVGDAVGKSLSTWAQKYASPEAIPSALYPAYRPPPEDLPLPRSAVMEHVLSASGIMLHNRSVWTLETAEPFAALKDWHERIAEQDWHVYPKSLNEEEHSCYIRASRGAEQFEAFEVRDGYRQRESGEPVRLVFRYSARMDREALNPVYEAMASDEDLPVKTGLAFFNHFSISQRERLVESWLAQDRLPFGAEMNVVRHLHDAGLMDEAKQRLRNLYLAALFEDGDQMKEMEKLGREVMEADDWKPSPATVEELVAGGVTPCRSNATQDVMLNEHATFLLGEGGDTEWALLDIAVRPSAIPEGIYTLEMRMRTGSDLTSGSMMSSSTPHSQEHPWKGGSHMSDGGLQWHADAVEIGTNRFSIAVERY